MHKVTEYPDGIFCWVDLSTTDPAAAKAFYAGLFGWEMEDVPIDTGGHYTMMRLEGETVAGLGEMDPGTRAQGVPSYWAVYIKHGDVDAVAQKAVTAGGRLLFPAMDVMEQGRMTMLMDPSGAMVGVWQPRQHTGAERVNQPNSLVWTELQTRQPDAAQAFYETVFDWTSSKDAQGYVVFAQNGRRHAGMITMDDSWGDVPANWAAYFLVEDVDAMAETARSLGGNVLVPPFDVGEMGRTAVLQDPQGAVFSIIYYHGPTDPPPGA